ncbi:MAG: kinase [Eubacteriales bacterium]|nr:kinase [Eubacteriales bacterium]
MRLLKIQDALTKKKIKFTYCEEDDCGSLDFDFRGLRYHVWEYHDDVWGVETNIFAAGRSEEVEGDYEQILSDEILSWPDMMM